MENAWRMMNPAKTREELRPGVQLLLDLRDLFARDGRARWSTAELITALIQGEDGTGDTIWAEMPALREGALGGKAAHADAARVPACGGTASGSGVCVTGRRLTTPPAAGIIFPRISMMPSPGISRLAAPVRATKPSRPTAPARRPRRKSHGGDTTATRPTTSPRNGSRRTATMHVSVQHVVPGSFLGPGDHPMKSSTSPSANDSNRGGRSHSRFGTRRSGARRAGPDFCVGPTLLSLAVSRSSTH